MYNFVSIMISLLTLLFVGLQNPQSSEERLVHNAKAHVKKVFLLGGGHCSSTIVSYKEKVRHITNAHCCMQPMFYNKQGVRFLKIDIPNDLCEISYDGMSKTGIRMSSLPIKPTNIVYTVGFPGPYDLTISQGRIVSEFYVSPLNNQFLYMTTSFTIGGSSGGAALDKNGDLYGIVSQGNGINHGQFIPLDTVKQFLN